MKISLKRTSPNYRQKLSTHQIMNELTLAVLALCLVSVGFNLLYRGSEYATHSILIFVCAVATSLVTEFIFMKVTKKEAAIKNFKNSFPLVTPLIYALTLPVGTPYYVVAVGAFIASFFGKLVYGGFGQNIFNPALVGRVLVHLSFGAQLTSFIGSDAATLATPLTTLKGMNFVGTVDTNLGMMFLGFRDGALGEPFVLVILVLGVILAWRKVLDYRIPVAYLTTVIVIALIQGGLNGLNPLTNALTHLALGGVVFGAVFMATDPVTSPTSPLGKVIYGIGLGFLTMLLRYQSNYPEGVMFSILLMNILVPLIDNCTLGRTNMKMVKQWATVAVMFVLSVGIVSAITSTYEAPEEDPNPVEPDKPAQNYELISKDGNVYVVSAQGFGGKVQLEVTFDGDTITSVQAVEYAGETDGYGKNLIESGEGGKLNEAAKTLHDLIFNSSMTQEDLAGADTSTGATITSKALINALNGAIEEKQNDPIVSAEGNVYVVRAAGFNQNTKMQVEVTMDKANRQVTGVKVLSYDGETEGYGKDLIEKGVVPSAADKKEAATNFFNTILNGSVGYDDLTGIDTATGATITTNGIIEAINTAIEAYDQVLDKSPDGVYTVKTSGFNNSEMTVEVKVSGTTVESVKVLEYAGETAGYGKDLIEKGEVSADPSKAEAAKAFYDTVLAGSFEQSALDGVDSATGATFTTQGIIDAVQKAVAADQQ